MAGSFYFSLMKLPGLLAMLAVLCMIFGLMAQTGRNKDYRKLMEDARRLYDLEEPTRKTDSLALDLFSTAAERALAAGDQLNAADCYIKAGNIHQTYQRFNEANRYYHSALLVNRQHHDHAHNRLKYEAFLFMGSSFYFNNIIDSAQYYFEQASAIATYYKGPSLPEQERLFNSLGAIYFESANYLQAKNYFEKALLVTPQNTTDFEESLVGISSNIANCLLRLNRYDSALGIYKSLSRYDMLPEVSEIIRQNTAHAYFEMGHYDSALAIYKNLSMTNALNRTKALNDIGRIYMNLGRWQQSEAVFDSAIAVNKSISSSVRNKEEALAYLYRGQLAARQGLTDEAITWCNEALQEVHLDFQWKAADDLPADISQSVSPVTLFQVLQTKAALLYKKYATGRQSSALNAAMLTYRKAIETANFIKINFDNDEAKLFFNESYEPVYRQAIAVSYEKYTTAKEGIDDYIYVLENYKGNVLHQNLQNIFLKSTAQVPDSVKRREKDLKRLLAFYTSRINNSAAEAEAMQLRKRLLDLQVQLSRLQKQYEKDEWFNLYRYQATGSGLTLQQLQQKVDGETALINFFVSDTVIYLLALSKEKSLVAKVALDKPANQHLRFFLKEIYQHTEGKRYEGNASASAIYRWLLAPAADVIDGCEKWVIIPDGLLYYLPVEALVNDEGDRSYIAETKTISYHYSFALLFQQNTHHTDDFGKGTVAFAPYTAQDEKTAATSLAVLPYSGNEVNDIAKSSFLSQNATKQRFTEIASQYSRIHLATHASSGSDSSSNWIQFYPADSSDLNNKLFLAEIYNLDLHSAELVILSACETAGGNSSYGEGLLSLSRAFLYAGSDGIISTLWKTEDQVTAYLMRRLHYHLAKHHAPEKALQLAKIDLLRAKEIGAKYKTPNYWSNFIYVGKIDAASERRYWRWWLGAALAALAMLVVLIRQWQKKGPGKYRNP
jgi:CHAT domain-containing protein/tetratricopeptide (TPR) repeat protein